jgi:uroporphyrinogen decarboxylase
MANTGSSTLTGVERVNRMMERRDHDRVPRFDCYWSETIARWQAEGLGGGKEAALDLLDADADNIGGFTPAPFPGRSEVISEDQTTRVVVDGFGARQREWKGRSGTPEHVGFDCDSADKWHDRYKPALLADPLQVDLDRLRDGAKAAASKQRWIMFQTIESYEFMKRLMGDEIALIAMATEPDWFADVSRTFTDVAIMNLQAIHDAGLPINGVFLSADMGYNHGPMFSPTAYRQLLRPDNQRMIDWCQQHDWKVFWHTDGNVNLLVDQFVEMGIDSLHPLENAAQMDLSELVPKFGDRLSFWGNQDKRIWECGDRQRIEAHVRDRLAAGMAKRGYGFHSDHSVQPDVSLDTYRFIVDLVDRFGRYTD